MIKLYSDDLGLSAELEISKEYNYFLGNLSKSLLNCNNEKQEYLFLKKEGLIGSYWWTWDVLLSKLNEEVEAMENRFSNFQKEVKTDCVLRTLGWCH